jgi:hypothetical protein
METSSDEGKVDLDLTEVSGNVRISIVPDGLIVTLPAPRTISSLILPALLCAFLLYVSGGIAHDLLDGLWGSKAAVVPALIFLIFSWMSFQLARMLFGRREVLRCTNDDLEVINCDFGYTWRRRTFSKQDVKGIEFASVGFSGYGAVKGLRFEGAGKQIKLLRGLRSAEAEKILTKLTALGFDTGEGPAIPATAEIE